MLDDTKFFDILAEANTRSINIAEKVMIKRIPEAMLLFKMPIKMLKEHTDDLDKKYQVV